MRTITLSEAEAHQLRGAARAHWQHDKIGDEPSAAELGEHAERAQLVASLLDAAEARACASSPALLERLAAYESEVAVILERATLEADRRVWEVALRTVRGLLARLRKVAGNAPCGRPVTVAEKVFSLLAVEEAQVPGLCHEVIGSSFSEHELDLLDWGLVFGMAYALTRVEEPCETARSAASRAKDAAIAAYGRWSDGVENIKAPDVDALVGGVVRAARAVERHKLPEPLETALDGLLNAVGGAA